MNTKEALWEKQRSALRTPSHIFGAPFADIGIEKKVLSFRASESFAEILHRLDITLLISREYENLLLALSSKDKDTIEQSFFHLPHPSGVAVSMEGAVYVAATRNPNQILEFRPSTSSLSGKKVLMPFRTRYYAGKNYFHDLAFIGDELYANAVGMNGVVKIDMTSSKSDAPIWWPKCVELNGNLDSNSNYIQLNSIAAGRNLANSYFSASGDAILTSHPGDIDYPVDKRGVIFSGKSREPIARGLTRPHSARFYKNEILVNNSGYGEVGRIADGRFLQIQKLPGWTRGLCIHDEIIFVGVSRVLPRFEHYAPGITGKRQGCGIYAIDMKSGEIVGSIIFPYGNQIFAIEHIPRKIASGFFYQDIAKLKDEAMTFFSYTF